MRKVLLLFVFSFIGSSVFGQTVQGISWVNWANEPDYEGVTGYDANPYDTPGAVAAKAPADWTPVTDVAGFDATWDLLGDPYLVANPTNVAGGDLYDLDDAETFGASWKAVYDDNNLYILLKYIDASAQVNDGSRSFEIMVQPTSIYRHEPTFEAAADSTAENTASGEDLVVMYQNQAYARAVELGGGKAMFTSPGAVGAYEASFGKKQEGWLDFWTGNWGNNEPGLTALATADHFWDESNGVIKAVMVMSFDGALAYPADPFGEGTDMVPFDPEVDRAISFDVKSNAKVDGTDDEGEPAELNVEYFWSADKNNGYASIYYSGILTFDVPVDPSDFTIAGISWVNWANEPDYEDVTGYDTNPYDNPEYTVYMAPAEWTPVSSVETFDATWELLGDANYVANPTNVDGGDLFDLDDGETFGASWKAVHDGDNLYVMLKYLDVNDQANDGSRSFEIMAQPTSPVRHEQSFVAAADSTAENTASGNDYVVLYQNQAYARVVELGGGKAMFTSPGTVGAYEASFGKKKEGWLDFWTGNWGNNEAGLEALALADHFWDDTDGIIRAVMVMSFDGALTYPTDPTDLAGSRTSLAVGSTIAFDVKSNAAVEGTDDEGEPADLKVEYFWSADKNNGYASNYYSGHVTISDVVLSSPLLPDGITTTTEHRVYVSQGTLFVRGESPVDLEIYNVVGSRIRSARNIQQLSLHDLDNGIYIVRIKGDPQGVKIMKY